MTRESWSRYDFVVQMPHMAPGEKLSEVELLKILAAWQWESIARALGRRPPELVNPQGERLYGSVIDVELKLGERHSMESLGEDVRIHVANRVRFFGRKLVEGLFVIDDEEIPERVLASIGTRKDLRAFRGSWAAMTNAFVARGGDNVRLKVFEPERADDRTLPALAETPLGIVEQGRVQRSGEIEPFDELEGVELPDRRGEEIRYEIVPESDLNGAGLVYFARYEAMMSYGERIFLSSHLEIPVSNELIECLSTERRRAYFFANASPSDTVLVRVSARLIPPDSPDHTGAGGAIRTPLRLGFRTDLYRNSDRVLMASSLVRKSLKVPAGAKRILAEAERLLRRLA